MDLNWDVLMWAGGIYSLLVSVWVFVDSPKRNLPRKRWAVSALFFPLIVPCYLKKTRPRTSLRYVLLWVGGFFLCYSGVAQLAGPEEDQTAKTAADLFRRSQASLSRLMEDFRAEYRAFLDSWTARHPKVSEAFGVSKRILGKTEKGGR